MTVDEIYKNIAEEIIFAVAAEEWEEAVLHVSIIDEETLEYEGEFVDADGETHIMDIEDMDPAIAEWFFELYNLMSDGESAWNEADFCLKPNGEFSLNLNTREQ